MSDIYNVIDKGFFNFKKLEVLIFRRPNMFAVNNNLYHLKGYGELEKLYTIEGYKAESPYTKIELFYPERFLNILEQRVLLKRLQDAGFTEVRIVTHSVYIIQTVQAKYCDVIQDELIPEGQDIFKLSNDEVGLPYDGGIGIL